MEFTNSFTVKAPLETVWAFMLDAREVAPCVPGAELTESLDATHHRGTVKVKLGAVQMSYRGELEIEPDEAARTIVLRARGSETRGSGGATGTFTTTLTSPPEGGTHVDIQTHVDVTGRVAQFGRGIMQDVANRMIKEFAGCLEQKLSANADVSGSSPPAQAAAVAHEEVAPQPPVDPPRTHVASGALSTPPAVPPVSGAEIQVGKLLAHMARSRIAAGLRVIAARIEPK